MLPSCIAIILEEQEVRTNGVIHLEWTKAIGALLISSPIASLIIALIFRRPLLILFERFASSDEGKAENGTVKIELGRLACEGQTAVDNLNRLNLLMGHIALAWLFHNRGSCVRA